MLDIPQESTRLQFVVGQFRQRFMELCARYADGIITVSPLGIPIPLSPSDSEMNVAREVLVRVSGKRVLDSGQCCRSCTIDALASLQEIRATIADQMVSLARSGYQDGGLYVILEFMQAGIVQFLNFTERRAFYPMSQAGPMDPRITERDIREVYIPALEDLRQHLLRCLVEVGTIARMRPLNLSMLYRPEWSDDDYSD